MLQTVNLDMSYRDIWKYTIMCYLFGFTSSLKKLYMEGSPINSWSVKIRGTMNKQNFAVCK